MKFSDFEAEIKSNDGVRWVNNGTFDLIKTHDLISSEKLPATGETVAVVMEYPKTAALLYDRILPVCTRAPEDIMIRAHVEPYFCELLMGIQSYMLELKNQATDSEKSRLRAISENLGMDHDPLLDSEEYVLAHILGMKLKMIHKGLGLDVLTEKLEQCIQCPQQFHSMFYKAVLRWYAEALWTEYRIPAVPLFCTHDDRNMVYTPGDCTVICSCLSNLDIVNENAIEWDQVEEFRKDLESRTKYRRFINWLDSDMVGKPRSRIENEIAIRLDDYRYAIRKHGLSTLIGSLSRVLRVKELIGPTVASGVVTLLSGEAISGLLAMGCMMVGKVAIETADAALQLENLKRSANPEISFVHCLEKKMHKA